MDFLANLTFDRWIALASSVGTLIAAGLSAFSIRELRLQRAQQFQPRIMPTSSSYELDLKPDDLLDFDRQCEKFISLINVGHGVATDLSVQWKVETDFWIDKINSLSALRDAGVAIERDNFGLSIRHKGMPTAGVRLPDVESRAIPYMLSVSANQEPLKIPLPGAIVAIVHAFYWSYFRKVSEVKGIFRNPKPEISFEMVVRYKDTIGRSYERKSVLDVCVLMAGETAESDVSRLGLKVVVEPVRIEPAEGYSIISKILLDVLKVNAKRFIGF